MFYQKTLKTKKPRVLELSITDFKEGINTQIAQTIMPYKYAINCYNFNYENGALIEGFGFDNLRVPQSPDDPKIENTPILPEGKEIDCIWHFKHYNQYQGKRLDKLMLYTKDKLLYYATLFNPMPMFFLVPGASFENRPTAMNHKINGKDVIILTSHGDNMVCWDGETMPQTISTAPKISSLTMHQDKLFASIGGEGNIIRYSSNLNPTGWNTDMTDPNNTYIELNDMRGSVNKLISFLGYVFAFRDFGITKIKSFEGTNQININHLFVSGNRLYKNTICVCGDRIVMLAKDGLYEFDGVSTKKIDLKIDALFEGVYNDQAVASYHEGKYYVSLKLNYPDDNQIGCQLHTNHINDTLIELDVKEKTFHIIRGIDVTSMTSIQVNSMSKMVFCFNTVYGGKLGQLEKNGRFFEDNTTKNWYSPISDLGFPATNKQVKQISLISHFDCSLTLFTTDKSKTFFIEGKKTAAIIRPNFGGEQLGFKIESLTDKAYISNAKIKLHLT